MRLPALALIFTIFTLPGHMLSVNANPTALHIRAPSSSNGTSSSTPTPSTTTSSSSSTISTSSSSTISTSFTPSTTTTSISSSFSSSETPSSSFSPSPSPSTTTQVSSTSQDTSSSSQSTQLAPSSTSSFVTSDTTSTSLRSQTQTPTQTRTTYTSTRSDGTLLTVTAVVSSPSGGSGSNIVNTARQGFFANTGAVAGTFVVVGLVGTGIFMCVFLWGLRWYRRRRRSLAYFDDEDKEFNQPGERGGTPEATLPDVIRDSPLDTPASSSPTPNMIERLHGNEVTIPNASYDSSLYQAQPGEFDPYRNLDDDAYAYSDDQAVHGQYPGNIQPGSIAYAYQPGTEFHSNTGQHQAAAEPSHAP